MKILEQSKSAVIGDKYSYKVVDYYVSYDSAFYHRSYNQDTYAIKWYILLNDYNHSKDAVLMDNCEFAEKLEKMFNLAIRGQKMKTII